MAKRKYPRVEEDLKYRMQNVCICVLEYRRRKIEALSNYSNSIDEFAAASRTSFSDITTYQSGRPITKEITITVPESVYQQIQKLLLALHVNHIQIGLIRNSIDLMGDFACKGVRLVHLTLE